MFDGFKLIFLYILINWHFSVRHPQAGTHGSGGRDPYMDTDLYTPEHNENSESPDLITGERLLHVSLIPFFFATKAPTQGTHWVPRPLRTRLKMGSVNPVQLSTRVHSTADAVKL